MDSLKNADNKKPAFNKECYDYDELYDKWWEAMERRYNAEELAEMGFIYIPKTRKIIPDGEQGFFSAIKSGEDW